MHYVTSIELDVSVDYEYYPPEKMTRDYPGSPDWIEVEAIYICGVKVENEELFNKLYDMLEENLLEDGSEKFEREKRDYGY